MKWWSENKRAAVFIFILLITVFLRFKGLYPGYHQFHPDEENIYSTAAYMIKNQSLLLLRYEYPIVSHLVNFFFYTGFFIPLRFAELMASNFKDILSGDIYKILIDQIIGPREINALYWGRAVTALIGSLTVFLSYILGEKLFNKRVGVIASILVSVNYRLVLSGHFVLPDTYNSFFLLVFMIFLLRLSKNPNRSKYLQAGVFAGIAASTKYQIYWIFPFLFIHWKQYPRLKFFNPKIIIFVLSVAIVLIGLSYSQILEVEGFISQIKHVSKLYGVGYFNIDLYPFSYLYHVGIGRMTSVIIILGLLLSTFKNFHKSAFLLLIIVPFFLAMTFYSRGGFYTRNFTTIIPFLMIYAGYFLDYIIRKRRVLVLLAVPIIILAFYENFSNSIIVGAEYSSDWNSVILLDWQKDKIKQDIKVAAHSSVPLLENLDRIPLDLFKDFSLEEVRQSESAVAILNLEWGSIDFYGWMRSTPKESLRYWEKPDLMLSQMFPSLAIREMLDFSAYNVINRWQAPESNYIVVNVPYYSSNNLEEMVIYDTEEDFLDWEEANYYWYKPDNLIRVKDGLAIMRDYSAKPFFSWISPPIEVSGWSGFDIRATVKSMGESTSKEGFVYAKLYNSKEGVEEDLYETVRLSSRIDSDNMWYQKNVKGLIGKDIKYMKVGFQSYNPKRSEIYLDKLTINKADVRESFTFPLETRSIKLDKNIIYPYSQSGL